EDGIRKEREHAFEITENDAREQHLGLMRIHPTRLFHRPIVSDGSPPDAPRAGRSGSSGAELAAGRVDRGAAVAPDRGLDAGGLEPLRECGDPRAVARAA